MSGIKFFKNFIKNPGKVGAVWPTGHSLANEIIGNLYNSSNLKIAEIGPGTGAVTKYIYSKNIHKENNFLAVEINNEFYDHLKEQFPRLKIYNDCATNLPKILKEDENIAELDAVISGLPWASFPEELQVSLLDAIIECLKPKGTFNTFAYLQGLVLPAGKKFRKLLDNYFAEIKTSRIVWNNVPPAIVYMCKK
ncbi:MAG: methyltransferase domain-containing protein [Victivallales bacterium]|nr:methyltransferase domain-containing protein [Victivallales bacterium]